MKKSLVASLLALGCVSVLSLTQNPVSAQQPKAVASYDIRVVTTEQGEGLGKEGWQCVGTFPASDKNNGNDMLVMQRQR